MLASFALFLLMLTLTFGVGNLASSRIIGLSYPERIVIGYGIWAVFLILSLRCFGSMMPAFMIVIPAALWGLRVGWLTLGRPHFTWLSATILITFLMCVSLVHFPLLMGGATYAMPDIYDTPKHVIALTALRSADTWPPASPFMPGLSFAYNFGFYALPAALLSFWPSASALPVYSLLIPFSATLLVFVSTRLAALLGTSARGITIVVLCATFVGGFTPLLLKDAVPMGYKLSVAGWITSMIWVDEPFISNIFIPQHLFAAVCLLITIMMTGVSGHPVTRIALACLVSLAGSISSLILLPHISGVLLVAVGVIAWYELRSWRAAWPAGAGLFAYGAILAPFILEAARWQAGASEPAIGLPPLDRTIPVVFFAFGPVAVLATFALRSLWAGQSPVRLTMLAAIAGIALATVMLKYSEAGIKGTLILRVLFTVVAGLGFEIVWRLARAWWLRGAIVAVIVLAIVINLPTLNYLALRIPGEYRGADRDFLLAVKRSKGPVLFDRYFDQRIVALAEKQTITDFRPVREDAYIPSDQRARYAALLADTQDAEAERERFGFQSVVTVEARRSLWEPRFGPPKAAAFGQLFFQKD